MPGWRAGTGRRSSASTSARPSRRPPNSVPTCPDVAIVQADLLDLPLAERQFDLVFSIGVLHHSPDPRRAFAQVAARVKPGGRLAVWLYRKNTPPQEWLNSGLRAVTTPPSRPRARTALRRPGRARRRPGPEPDPEQGGQLLEPPRLDPPRLRQLRLVRPALPVAPHRRRAAAAGSPRKASTTSSSSPRPAPAGSTTGPIATTSSSAAASTWPARSGPEQRRSEGKGAKSQDDGPCPPYGKHKSNISNNNQSRISAPKRRASRSVSRKVT